MPQAGVLALQGLSFRGEVQPGQEVLINGAGGGVGTFAIQLAKASGAVVTGVDLAAKLEGLGFDEVIDYRHERFADAAAATTGSSTSCCATRSSRAAARCVQEGSTGWSAATCPGSPRPRCCDR